MDSRRTYLDRGKPAAASPLAGARGAVRRASRSSNRRSAGRRAQTPANCRSPLAGTRQAVATLSYKQISADPIPCAT